MSEESAPVRLLNLGGRPGLHTQAIYHVLAERMAESRPDTVVLTWPRDPYLCLGYHQRAEDILDLEAARARGLEIVRRRVGGGLTYLDEHQVFYQFVFHHRRAPRVPRALYSWLLGPPVSALRRLGVPARLECTNEVEVGPRRIAGIGAGRIGEASVVVGNVLLDFDYEAMSAVWPAHTRAFHELAAAAVRERVTTLRREGVAADRDEVIAILAEEIAAGLGREVFWGELTDDEEEALEPMVARLSAPEFVRLRSDDARSSGPLLLKISARAYIGVVVRRRGSEEIRVSVRLRDERIVEAHVEGVVVSEKAALECALIGRELTAIDEVLAHTTA